uniref:PDZ domain-containing protein n=1 Tax=Macrostomum lignano TaxID=282301 RepID=A0A1I8HPU9_9PLAT
VRSGGIGDPHPAGVPDEGAQVTDIVRGGQLVHPLGVAEVFVPRLVEVRAEGDVMLRGLLSYATERTGGARTCCLFLLISKRSKQRRNEPISSVDEQSIGCVRFRQRLEFYGIASSPRRAPGTERTGRASRTCGSADGLTSRRRRVTSSRRSAERMPDACDRRLTRRQVSVGGRNVAFDLPLTAKRISVEAQPQHPHGLAGLVRALQPAELSLVVGHPAGVDRLGLAANVIVAGQDEPAALRPEEQAAESGHVVGQSSRRRGQALVDEVAGKQHSGRLGGAQCGGLASNGRSLDNRIAVSAAGNRVTFLKPSLCVLCMPNKCAVFWLQLRQRVCNGTLRDQETHRRNGVTRLMSHGQAPNQQFRIGRFDNKPIEFRLGIRISWWRILTGYLNHCVRDLIEAGQGLAGHQAELGGGQMVNQLRVEAAKAKHGHLHWRAGLVEQLNLCRTVVSFMTVSGTASSWLSRVYSHTNLLPSEPKRRAVNCWPSISPPTSKKASASSSASLFSLSPASSNSVGSAASLAISLATSNPHSSTSGSIVDLGSAEAEEAEALEAGGSRRIDYCRRFGRRSRRDQYGVIKVDRIARIVHHAAEHVFNAQGALGHQAGFQSLALSWQSSARLLGRLAPEIVALGAARLYQASRDCQQIGVAEVDPLLKLVSGLGSAVQVGGLPAAQGAAGLVIDDGLDHAVANSLGGHVFGFLGRVQLQLGGHGGQGDAAVGQGNLADADLDDIVPQADAQQPALAQRLLQMLSGPAQAQLVSMRTDLASAQAAAASSAGAASAKASSSLADVDAQPPQPASSDSAKSEILKFERDIVVNENAELRRYCLALQTELYAARLTAKYLNKELAGRVQQMQLLTASSNGTGLDGVSGGGSGGSGGGRHPMGPGERRRLWSQLEAEIRLHRCKTLLRASRGRSVARFLPNNGLAPGQEESLTDCSPRQVSVSKDPGEGLGVSIVGGREHGAPILISELHPGLPAARCGLIHVGDAILSVDGVSLREARHHDAVQVLSHLRESTVELTLVFVADVDQPGSADDDEVTDEDEDDRFVDLATGYRFRMYDDEMTTCHGNQLRKKLKNKTEVKLQPSQFQAETHFYAKYLSIEDDHRRQLPRQLIDGLAVDSEKKSAGSALLRKALTAFSSANSKEASCQDDGWSDAEDTEASKSSVKKSSANTTAIRSSNIGVARRRRAEKRRELAKRELTLRKKLVKSRTDRLVESAAAAEANSAEKQSAKLRLKKYRTLLQQATVELERELATYKSAGLIKGGRGNKAIDKQAEASQAKDKRQQKQLALARELDFKRFNQSLREILVSTTGSANLGGGSSDDSLVAVGLVTGLLLVVASLVAMVNLSRRKLHIASTAVKVPPCLVASLLLGLACPPGCLATGIILLRHSLASSVSQEAACGDPPLLNEIASGANYTTQSSRIASSSSIEAPLIWSRACLLASLSVAMVTACLLTVALAMEIRRFRRMRHRMERTLLHRMDSDGHRCDDGALADIVAQRYIGARTPGETVHTLVLAADGHQVAHWRVGAALHQSSEKLSSLREPDGVVAALQFGIGSDRLAHLFHLLVGVGQEPVLDVFNHVVADLHRVDVHPRQLLLQHALDGAQR